MRPDSCCCEIGAKSARNVPLKLPLDLTRCNRVRTASPTVEPPKTLHTRHLTCGSRGFHRRSIALFPCTISDFQEWTRFGMRQTGRPRQECTALSLLSCQKCFIPGMVDAAPRAGCWQGADDTPLPALAPGCRPRAAFGFKKIADPLLERGISYVTMACWPIGDPSLRGRFTAWACSHPSYKKASVEKTIEACLLSVVRSYGCHMAPLG